MIFFQAEELGVVSTLPARTAMFTFALKDEPGEFFQRVEDIASIDSPPGRGRRAGKTPTSH